MSETWVLFTIGIVAAVLLAITFVLEEKWCAYIRPRVATLTGWGCLGAFLMCVFWFVLTVVLIFTTVTCLGASGQFLINQYF